MGGSASGQRDWGVTVEEATAMVQGGHVLLVLSDDRSAESRFYCFPVCAHVLARAKTLCDDCRNATLICVGLCFVRCMVSPHIHTREQRHSRWFLWNVA